MINNQTVIITKEEKSPVKVYNMLKDKLEELQLESFIISLQINSVVKEVYKNNSYYPTWAYRYSYEFLKKLFGYYPMFGYEFTVYTTFEQFNNEFDHLPFKYASNLFILDIDRKDVLSKCNMRNWKTINRIISLASHDETSILWFIDDIMKLDKEEKEKIKNFEEYLNEEQDDCMNLVMFKEISNKNIIRLIRYES